MYKKDFFHSLLITYFYKFILIYIHLYKLILYKIVEEYKKMFGSSGCTTISSTSRSSSSVCETNATRIRRWIQNTKLSSNQRPSLTTASQAMRISTDRNEFPYPRTYRGKALTSSPVILEREAGYSPVLEFQVTYQFPDEARLTSASPLCFQTACSTILPCTPNVQNQMSRECVAISP